MSTFERLDGGTPDGAQIGGATTDKLGFYGATPVVKTAVAATAVTAVGTTVISQVATSGKWGFSTSTAATALVTRVRQLQVDVEGLIGQLNTLGIV
jgi:hypothetical protein